MRVLFINMPRFKVARPEFNPYLAKSRNNIAGLWEIFVVNDTFEIKFINFTNKHKKISIPIFYFLIVLNLVTIIYCTRGKFTVVSHSTYFKSDVVTLVSIISDILLAAINILGIWPLIRNDYFLEMITLLSLGNHTLADKDGIVRNTAFFRKWLKNILQLLLRIVPLVPISIEIYLLGKLLGWRSYQYFCVRHIWYFVMHLMMFTFICLLLRIKDSFTILNNHLDKMTTSFEVSSVAHIETSDILLNRKPEKAALIRLQNFQTITSHHNNLCNILDKFNSASKAFLVMSIMCITSNVLFNFTAIMLYAVKRIVLGGFDAKLLIMVTQPIFTMTSVSPCIRKLLSLVGFIVSSIRNVMTMIKLSSCPNSVVVQLVESIMAPIAQRPKNSKLLYKQRNKLDLENNNIPAMLKFVSLTTRYKNARRFLQVCSIVFHMYYYIYSTNEKLTILRQGKEMRSNVVTFVIFLDDLIFMLVNIFGIIAVSYTSNFMKLFKKILIEKKSILIVKERRIFFQFCILLLYLLALITVSIDIYFHQTYLDWARNNVYFYKCICFGSVNATVCHISLTLNKVKEKFTLFNDYLEHIFNEKLCSDFKSNRRKLRDLQNYHDNLCNLLNSLNGYSKTFIVIISTCVCIDIIQNVIVVTEQGVIDKVINGVSLKKISVVLQPLYILTSLGQAAVIAFVGEGLEDEGMRTSRICYNFLNKLNGQLKSENGHLIHKEVKFLLDQSKSRKISLHAGGFFKLNWGILGSITSTVATYSIVIIQFLLK